MSLLMLHYRFMFPSCCCSCRIDNDSSVVVMLLHFFFISYPCILTDIGFVPISTIPSKWFERTNKQVSRWETTNEQVEEGGRRWASLVRIPTEDMINESENDDRGMVVGRRGFEPPIPAMSRLL
jgi:hypothetical protein